MANQVGVAARAFSESKGEFKPSKTFKTISAIREARFLERGILSALDEATKKSDKERSAGIKSLLANLRGQPVPSNIARAIHERRAE